VRGDEVLACIVLRKADNQPPPEKIASSIVRHVLGRLAYFKAPGYVAFVDALPLTTSQKVQRGELRELAKRLPGTPQCYDMRMLKARQKRLGGNTGQGLLTGQGALTEQGGLTQQGDLTQRGGLTEHGFVTEDGFLTEHGRPTEHGRLTEDGRLIEDGAPPPTAPGPLPPVDDEKT